MEARLELLQRMSMQEMEITMSEVEARIQKNSIWLSFGTSGTLSEKSRFWHRKHTCGLLKEESVSVPNRQLLTHVVSKCRWAERGN